jgi:hypothetical protein
MENEEYDFNPGTQTPLGDIVRSISLGDIDSTARQLRDTTSWQLDSALIWGIIAVAAINAIANLVRRTGDAARPITDAMADRMRQVSRPPPS